MRDHLLLGLGGERAAADGALELGHLMLEREQTLVEEMVPEARMPFFALRIERQPTFRAYQRLLLRLLLLMMIRCWRRRRRWFNFNYVGLLWVRVFVQFEVRCECVQ